MYFFDNCMNMSGTDCIQIVFHSHCFFANIFAVLIFLQKGHGDLSSTKNTGLLVGNC